MSDRFAPKPVTLVGTAVRLEPLGRRHAADLFSAGADPAIWTHMPMGGFAGLAAVELWIDRSIAAMEGGSDLPFAIIEQGNGRAVGSSRYMDIRREHRGLEIGWTWLAPEAQRTRVNTEAKFLLLEHAFEGLGAVRVQLKTDGRNVRSQRAIERIGAVREGVLRRHMVMWNGFVRDTVYYSVLDREWPQVKERLLARLAGE